jgi:tetratricopeptide (TPR) repeat protein
VADEPTNDLEVVNPDAGFAFRAEMFMTNVVMGYWKIIVGVLVTFLACVLVYGNYLNWYTGGQYDTSDQVANVLRQFDSAHPKVLAPGSFVNEYSLYTSAPLALGADEELRRHAQIAAEKLGEIGASGTGTSGAQAYVLSSEFYRILGQPEKRKLALEAAATMSAAEAQGAFSLALASTAHQAGDVDAGLDGFSAGADTYKGTFVAQWALLERARVLRDLGRKDEAIADLDALITAYPDGSLKDMADAELAKLSPDHTPAPEDDTEDAQ